MTFTHDYDVVQSSFTALKILSVPLISPSPSPGTTDLFTVRMILPFPDGPIVGAIQYVAFLCV